MEAPALGPVPNPVAADPREQKDEDTREAEVDAFHPLFAEQVLERGRRHLRTGLPRGEERDDDHRDPCVGADSRLPRALGQLVDDQEDADRAEQPDEELAEAGIVIGAQGAERKRAVVEDQRLAEDDQRREDEGESADHPSHEDVRADVRRRPGVIRALRDLFLGQHALDVHVDDRKLLCPMCLEQVHAAVQRERQEERNREGDQQAAGRAAVDLDATALELLRREHECVLFPVSISRHLVRLRGEIDTERRNGCSTWH
jgi:hypothetical protein